MAGVSREPGTNSTSPSLPYGGRNWPTSLGSTAITGELPPRSIVPNAAPMEIASRLPMAAPIAAAICVFSETLSGQCACAVLFARGGVAEAWTRGQDTRETDADIDMAVK